MADVKYYDVILKPVVTEKSMNAMAEKKYTFLVHTDATKNQIKEAVDEPGRKEPSPWNGSWQDFQDQESNRYPYC